MEDLMDIIGIPECAQDTGLPDPKMLSYYQLREDRKLWLDTEITDDNIMIVRDIMYFNAVDNEENIPVEDREPIRLYIHSVGGELCATNAIINAIKLSKTPVITINMGIALSGGLFILLAGHKRIALPWSTVLIHSGSGGANGTFEQSKSNSAQWEYEIRRLQDYLLERTSISKQMFNKHKSSEWYLNDDEQLKYGIVDEIATCLDDIM